MNCIIVDDDDASRSVLTQMIKQVDYLNIIKTCSTPLEAMNTLKKENPDVLFLDIEMPEMSGMEMLRALDTRPQVILITSHTEYALDAFDLNVVDYLIKPITLPRFLKAISKVKDSSDIKEQFSMSRDYFFIKKNSVLNKVPVKDILWIEALGDYINIHTKDERFILHSTLKSLENKLHAGKFVRVHRSYIVQIDNVKKVEDTTIFINDQSIPIGAIYKENFIKQINTLQ
jgi:two-component system LytT family response regulator